MAAFGTKVVVLMMVLPSLLLLQTSSVEAVDFLIYDENGCAGTAEKGCYGIDAGICCHFIGAPAVQIVNLLKGETATVYTGGGCTTEVARLVGPDAGECYSDNAYSGVFWYYNT